jgi:acetyltransferase-like isoleucine patch superfamily enzyme
LANSKFGQVSISVLIGKEPAAVKSLLNWILKKIKHDRDYALDPKLTAGDILAMLWKLACSLVRMFSLRWRFKSATGLGFIDPGAIIRNPGYISLGRNVVIEGGAEIQGLSQQGVTLGDQVTVGRLAMVRPSGYYGREMGEGLVVGDRSNIGPFCYIGCGGMVRIGQDVLMGPRVSIIAESHHFQDLAKTIKSQGVNRRGIVIEDNCWLGANSVILDGVRIGSGSIVAAGCVVTKDVPGDSIVAGVPGKVIKKRGGN